ncbi:HAD-IIIC family phosphatase [Campylobacter hepaticus]|uniref:HAD-IIIC family phosphatase n=1 Tax=Campylobacter hepaticus TaxID=1813019 RepID=A0A6A7JU74_9BACT|nr:HAD-IIIC family phosphatase [Campylobacter hepaticus]AXP09032.1 HAD-IIIC family phosphatase [Campylobacter hepaticus]MCZ0771926.1 HAD-IIIC family phosphatase [Campylobacter hepaticus]MCZ0773395.1 HAD-IIIC family phosphatase [Campylobacter hepaticus]MCZ0774646.1 HAD-IIIC family phosphatase [Campylobacter hepaticus]MDX2323991.1 HAD-IIIC family phosphatase [Campylobacter hepaticus]
MKTIVIDLDGTLTIDEDNVDYANKKPNFILISILKEYKQKGFKINIFTSRNMRTWNADIEKIQKYTLPTIISWLKKYDIPYDEVIIGKPWCGYEGFYVDDKAIRPSEFINLTYDQIKELLKKENPYKDGGK